MKSQFTEKQITNCMKERGIARSSALKFLNRERAAEAPTAAAPAPVIAAAAAIKAGRKCGMPGCKGNAVDHGQFCEAHGGNGKPLVTEEQVEKFVADKPKAEEPKPATPEAHAEANVEAAGGKVVKAKKAPKAVVAPMSADEAMAKRVAGTALRKLAGNPTKEQIVAVYGPKGPDLTWPERAALGVDAEHFQEALKSGKCVAPAAKEEVR
ncbi:MAG: hypothetical protein LAN64_01750 [Acidobacteriia bacterium]|nr:hypothetical protein [Terriglobia bacterium]